MQESQGSLGKGGPGGFSHFLGPSLCSKYSFMLWHRGTAWNPSSPGLTATLPGGRSEATVILQPPPKPCVGDQTYTIHPGLTCITSPRGLLSKHAFPVSRRHAPATSARFLSCTDGLRLSVGKQCEAILGWFLNFLGSLIRRRSADVQLKPASPKCKLE